MVVHGDGEVRGEVLVPEGQVFFEGKEVLGELDVNDIENSFFGILSSQVMANDLDWIHAAVLGSQRLSGWAAEAVCGESSRAGEARAIASLTGVVA